MNDDTEIVIPDDVVIPELTNTSGYAVDEEAQKALDRAIAERQAGDSLQPPI